MAQSCRIRAAAIAAFASWLLAGCDRSIGSSVSDADRQTAIALKLAGIAYGEYLAANRGVPPKDAAALRKHIESRLPDLQANGVTNADELLTSPRDGEPFVVITGQRLAPPDDVDAPWALYEATGNDGKRMVGSARGVVVELSPEEFAKQVPGAE
jgi:hypothetical protein